MALVLLLLATLLSGCASKQEKALEQARKQAAATGQAQQVVTVDKNGTTTTTVVQPPASGQKTEAVSTTTTPPAPGAPLPAASGPTVSAVPSPPAPVNVTVPAGTALAIRIDQRISVKTSRAGDPFTGEVFTPIQASDGTAIIPKGAQVGGVVVESHRRGHFKGRSVLELRLTSIALNGTRYRVDTSDLERIKKGKGRRSAGMIAGGSGLGMLVGGVATGGVGLVVGGLVGGGAGTAAAGLTGNHDIEIPAESVVNFTLAGDLIVREAQP
ncbi:MAG: hypothetical protein WBE72_24615 [Terracidiphilus sp.]